MTIISVCTKANRCTEHTHNRKTAKHYTLARLDAAYDSPERSRRPQIKKTTEPPLGPSSPVVRGSPSRRSRIPTRMVFIARHQLKSTQTGNRCRGKIRLTCSAAGMEAESIAVSPELPQMEGCVIRLRNDGRANPH